MFQPNFLLKNKDDISALRVQGVEKVKKSVPRKKFRRVLDIYLTKKGLNNEIWWHVMLRVCVKLHNSCHMTESSLFYLKWCTKAAKADVFFQKFCKCCNCSLTVTHIYFFLPFFCGRYWTHLIQRMIQRHHQRRSGLTSEHNELSEVDYFRSLWSRRGTALEEGPDRQKR